LKLKHVFFDLDHTLWDFDTNARLALEELYERHQLREFGVEAFERFYMMYASINEKMWEQYRNGLMSKENLRVQRFEETFRKLGVPDEHIPVNIWDEYLAITPEKTNLIPGAMDLLNWLASNQIRLHIITNGFKETQKRKLKASGLDEFFSSVIISEDVGVQKPHPQIFKHALEHNNAKVSDSIYIGDHPEADVRGGIDAGLAVAFYNPGRVEHNFNVLADLQELMQLPPLIIENNMI
jgi:putative hydrolase of the HAD superfamily